MYNISTIPLIRRESVPAHALLSFWCCIYHPWDAARCFLPRSPRAAPCKTQEHPFHLDSPYKIPQAPV